MSSHSSFTLLNNPAKGGIAAGRHSTGFTLIELLVVIAILAILATAIVVVINPVDLIKQSRDSTRLTDLNAINKALGLFDVTNPDDFTGTSTVVYVSVPDSTSTCANLGLPTLPSGYSYYCVASASSTRIDGTGWIPVNFAGISYGSPLGKLPLDPVNTTSTGAYYTYVMGGSWALSAKAESTRNRGGDKAAGNDGGKSFSSFEVGNDFNLTPLVLLENGRDSDLIGHWLLGAGTSTTAHDYSGNGRNGTITAGSGGWAINQQSLADQAYDFDGTNSYIRITGSQSSDLNLTDTLTLSAWIKTSDADRGDIIVKSNNSAGTIQYIISYNFAGDEKIRFALNNKSAEALILFSTTTISDDTWTFVTATYDGANARIYINGELDAEDEFSGLLYQASKDVVIGAFLYDSSYILYAPSVFDGEMSDVRIYNRVLSAVEISSIYNATR